MMVTVDRANPDQVVETPATVLCHQDWITGSVMMVHVNQENLDRIAESPATVLYQPDWSMQFVVMVDVNLVIPEIDARKIRNVLSHLI